jgi:hypothetical protein
MIIVASAQLMDIRGRLPLELRRSVFRRTCALMGCMKFCIPEYPEVCIESSGAAQGEAQEREIRR